MLLLCSTAMAAGQIALAGENKALKAELENQLSGKTVVSKIVFGGRAVPPGYQGDYPVNTLVYPETGAVTYRVEWGVMRADVAEQQMQRHFDSGTSFRVSGIDLKDDRLELKLDSGSGGSARLKLMLGAGWQSKFDGASVQAQLARVFVLDQRPEPTQGTTIASTNPSSSNEVEQKSHQQPERINGPDAQVSPASKGVGTNEATPHSERLSKEELDTLLATANPQDVLSGHALRILNALVAYQKRVGAPCHRDDIPKLQKKYGNSRTIDAFAANDILGVYLDCSRYQGQYIPISGVYDEKGFVLSLKQQLQNPGTSGGSAIDPTATMVLGIRDIEAALDADDYLQALLDYEAVRAGSGAVELRRKENVRPSVISNYDLGNVFTYSPEYWSYIANRAQGNVSDVPIAAEYLRRTTALYEDLKRFAKADSALVKSDFDAAKGIRSEIAYDPIRQQLSSRIEQEERRIRLAAEQAAKERSEAEARAQEAMRPKAGERLSPQQIIEGPFACSVGNQVEGREDVKGGWYQWYRCQAENPGRTGEILGCWTMSGIIRSCESEETLVIVPHTLNPMGCPASKWVSSFTGGATSFNSGGGPRCLPPDWLISPVDEKGSCQTGLFPGASFPLNAPVCVGPRQELKCPGCMTIRVLKSTWVNITTTDRNGYTHASGPPLQRMVVSVEKSGDFNNPTMAEVYRKGSTLDVICYVTNDGHGKVTPSCPSLLIGSVHDTPLMSNYVPPYLQQQFNDGSAVGWQVLEVCHGENCVAVSTINSR
jgi:hypothetical protein